MRNEFINSLCIAAKTNEKIVLVVGDLGYSVVEPFAEEFPDRFINSGIAEQNMMGLAAGLASEGYHVFVYSIANFPTFRCAEQIRNDVDYHKLDVTIVTVGGGVAYGNLGYSHHAVQDLALMRTMPNMRIFTPTDAEEVAGCMAYLVKNPQPSYLRLGKAGEAVKNKSGFYPIPGKLNELKVGNVNKAIIFIGRLNELAFNLGSEPAFKNFSICSLPCWSMQDKQVFANELKRYNEVLVIEDHFKDAGLCSWVQEVKSEYLLDFKASYYGLGFDSIRQVASEATLMQKGGLCVKNITTNYLRGIDSFA